MINEYQKYIQELIAKQNEPRITKQQTKNGMTLIKLDENVSHTCAWCFEPVKNISIGHQIIANMHGLTSKEFKKLKDKTLEIAMSRKETKIFEIEGRAIKFTYFFCSEQHKELFKADFKKYREEAYKK